MLNGVRYWYRPRLHWLMIVLLPFTFLFFLVIQSRYLFYRCGLFKTHRFPVPVVVIGNIIVGGTGKTPLVIWLAHYLQTQGHRPGIVSRGYGAKRKEKVCVVTPYSNVDEVGDEALMIARRTKCPMVVGKDRVLAAQTLLTRYDCTVVIADDGLQHYALERDIEIVVMDGERQWGNGYLLPAGPLREPLARLKKADCVVVKNGTDKFAMHLQPQPVTHLNGQQTTVLENFKGKTIHAVAGIGHPTSFFNILKRAGCQLIPHAFPDHHRYIATDLLFDDNHPVIMTEKDAVKCVVFAKENFWYLPVNAELSDDFKTQIMTLINRRSVNNEIEMA